MAQSKSAHPGLCATTPTRAPLRESSAAARRKAGQRPFRRAGRILLRRSPPPGLNRSDTRLHPGAIPLRSCSHLLAIGGSTDTKPVIFPPGRPRLATKPPPIGSATFANTIGIERAARSAINSGVSPAKSTGAGGDRHRGPSEVWLPIRTADVRARPGHSPGSAMNGHYRAAEIGISQWGKASRDWRNPLVGWCRKNGFWEGSSVA